MEKLKQSVYDLEELECILYVLKSNRDLPYYLDDIILKIENDIEYHKNRFRSVFKF